MVKTDVTKMGLSQDRRVLQDNNSSHHKRMGHNPNKCVFLSVTKHTFLGQYKDGRIKFLHKNERITMKKSNSFILSLLARKKLSALAEECTVSIFEAI